jgi:hypothetical protein
MAEFAAMEVLHLCRLFLFFLLADPYYPAYESSLLVLHILDNSLALGLLVEPLLFARS